MLADPANRNGKRSATVVGPSTAINGIIAYVASADMPEPKATHATGL